MHIKIEGIGAVIVVTTMVISSIGYIYDLIKWVLTKG